MVLSGLASARFLRMVEPEPWTAWVSGTEFVVWMVSPLAVGGATCVSRRVHYAAGAFVPGTVVGWMLGCVTFVLLSMLALLQTSGDLRAARTCRVEGSQAQMVASYRRFGTSMWQVTWMGWGLFPTIIWTASSIWA